MEPSMVNPEELLSDDTRFVRITWVDNAGIIRGEALHRDHLLSGSQRGFYISQSAQGLPVMNDAIVPASGFGPAGGAWLMPDWQSLRSLPFAPGLAAVMCHFVDVEGAPWSCCPRACLQRAHESLQSLGYDCHAAFENEFYLLHRTEDGYAPFDQSHYASAMGLTSAWHVLDMMADALQRQGVPVQNMMSESGPGQFEIVVDHRPAMTAADNFIAVRETVHAVAGEHDLIASFMPKIFPEVGGNGCHMHFSLSQDGRNVFPNPDSNEELSEIGRSALAGVLNHLPALAALTTPCLNSYRRITPGTWSGAYQIWGHDNKEAPLRVPASRGPDSPTNIELKTFDATANPYIGLAGVMAAAHRGLVEHMPLPPAVDVDPASLPQGDCVPMPRDMGEALVALQADDVLCDMLGSDLARAYLGVKQAEWAALEHQSHEEVTELMLELF